MFFILFSVYCVQNTRLCTSVVTVRPSPHLHAERRGVYRQNWGVAGQVPACEEVITPREVILAEEREQELTQGGKKRGSPISLSG